MQRRYQLLRTYVIKTPEFRFTRPVKGFESFAKGELIATDGAEEIRAPEDITILMPARQAIVGREGLKQVSDTGALEKAVEAIIAANPGQVAEYRGGKEKLLGFFVGQAMKATGGKANPAMLQEIVKKKLAP